MSMFIKPDATKLNDESVQTSLADAAVDVIKNIITNEEFDLTIDGKISGNALFGLTTVSQSFKAIQTYP